jgi:glycosyltransferase involved in cell wall biosynthesis
MVEISGGEDNVNFFEPSNVQSLALKLREFLNNYERNSRKSLMALRWARSHHHIEKHVQRLLDLYDDICSDRKSIHSLAGK